MVNHSGGKDLGRRICTVSTFDPAIRCHVYSYAISRGVPDFRLAQYKMIGTELNSPGLHGAFGSGAHLK
jgi:hypothetical protein